MSDTEHIPPPGPENTIVRGFWITWHAYLCSLIMALVGGLMIWLS